MVGEKIKKLRIEKDLLQKVLAQQLNLSQQTISLYEAGKREPDYETLEKIADFFNVSTDYLLGRTNIKNIEQTSGDKQNDNSNPFLSDFEELGEESQKELQKYMELLKIKEQMEKSKDETSSALENEA